MNKSTKVISSMVAIVAVATAFSLSTTPSTEPTVEPAKIGAVTSHASTCVFYPKETAAFAFETQATPVLEGKKESPMDRFAGILSWTVQSSAKTSVLRAALNNVSWDQTLSTPDERVDVQTIEGKPFFLRINEQCQFVGVGFPTSWPESSRTAVRTLLGSFEMVLPQGGQQQWTAKQRDGIGAYEGHYSRLLQTKTQIQIARQKRSYALNEASQLGVRIQVFGAMTTASFNRRQPSWFQRVEGREQIRLKLPNTKPLMFKNIFSIKRADAQYVAVADASLKDAQFGAQTTQKQVLKPDVRLAKVSRQDALKRFIAAHKAQDGMHGAALELAKWLQQHPEGAAALLADYRAGRMEKGIRAAFFLALELAATPQTRKVLLEVVDDANIDELDRTRGAIALAGHGEPTQEAAQMLLKHAQQHDTKMVRNASILGIGSMARRADGPLHESLRSTLQKELASQKGKPLEVVVVDALGNTKDDAFVADLGTRLHDERPMMRARSAEALSHMSPKSARPELIKRLAVEKNSNVRIRIIVSLKAFGPHPFAEPELVLAATLLAQAKEIKERVVLVDWLANSKDELARQVVINHFPNEPSARLKQYIGKFFSVTALRGG